MLAAMVTAALFGLVADAALGQAGLGQRMRNWQLEGQHVDLQGDFFLFGDSETEDGDDYELTMYKGRGRARLDTEGTSRWQPTIGFDLVRLDITTDSPALPGRLTQQRIGAGLRLGEIKGWEIEAVGGIGYAGDVPYNDEDAVFAHGTVAASKDIDESSSWLVALNWDGNRSFVPDVPVPTVVYNKTVSEKLSYSIGLPYSQVKWTPTEKWELRLAGVPVVSMNAIAIYKLNRAVRLYGSFNSQTEAFQPADRDDGDRLFFEQRRIEAGAIVGLQRWLSMRVAGGYAFDQEFSRGWHIIDTDPQLDIDAAPYLRVTADLRF
jgi:hypothetical protein